MNKVAVVGTGTWGTTLAVLLSQKGLDVRMLARASDIAGLRERRENKVFLSGIKFPDALLVSEVAEVALRDTDAVIIAVPAQTFRSNIVALKNWLPEQALVVSATKGLEVGSCSRMSDVMLQEMGADSRERILALSGPNLAREVALGLPATTVVAGGSSETRQAMQDLLRTPSFRVYTNPDIVGVELAGALKNVVALAAGICDGVGAGNNAKAALVTRGLAEISRLGLAAGAEALTFAGLAGLGDLVATCSSSQSRNHWVGEQLAAGRSLRDIEGSTPMVAEGVATTVAACELASRLGVEMPIASLMRQVLFEGKRVADAARELMAREPKSELQGKGNGSI